MDAVAEYLDKCVAASHVVFWQPGTVLIRDDLDDGEWFRAAYFEDRDGNPLTWTTLRSHWPGKPR